jgi:putative ABC transport system substrate-binding protein
MKRRDFIALLGGAMAAWPLAAGAQTPPKIPRVGYIAGSSTTGVGHIVGAFRQRLRELGYVEGQTIALEVRYAEGRMERIPELVAELVGLKMDVLVAPTSQAALAAKKATGTIPIPIVMVGADPVGLGLVASLARPGGNVTGLSYFNEAIIAKRVQLLKECVPGLAQIAVLRNPSVAVHATFWQETEMAARTLGVALQPLDVRGPEDFEAAFAAATRGNAQALVAFDDPLTVAYRPRIVALAASSRLPAMYGFREFPDEGGLMSHSQIRDLLSKLPHQAVHKAKWRKPSRAIRRRSRRSSWVNPTMRNLGRHSLIWTRRSEQRVNRTKQLVSERGGAVNRDLRR